MLTLPGRCPDNEKKPSAEAEGGGAYRVNQARAILTASNEGLR